MLDTKVIHTRQMFVSLKSQNEELFNIVGMLNQSKDTVEDEQNKQFGQFKYLSHKLSRLIDEFQNNFSHFKGRVKEAKWIYDIEKKAPDNHICHQEMIIKEMEEQL